MAAIPVLVGAAGTLYVARLLRRWYTAGRSEDSRPSPFTPAVESTGILERVVQAASSDDAGGPAAARAGRSRSFASAMVRSPMAAGRRVLSRLLSRSKDPIPPAGAPAAAAGEGAAHGAAAAKLQAAARGRRARAARKRMEATRPSGPPPPSLELAASAESCAGSSVGAGALDLTGRGATPGAGARMSTSARSSRVSVSDRLESFGFGLSAAISEKSGVLR